MINVYMGGVMRKQAGVKDDDRITIMTEYGRQRLLNYAESFRDLADLFEEEEAFDRESGGAEDTADSRSGGGTEADVYNRQNYLWQRKLQENQELMAEHLKEMAHIMARVAKETCLYRPMGARRYRQMARLLKDSGILLKDFFELEHEDGHTQISLTMRVASGRYLRSGDLDRISAEDVADYISAAVNVRLRAARSAPMYLTPEWNTYYFLEEPQFQFLTGAAKAVKETEKVSGDNYSFHEGDDGKVTIILSDGMGSGEKACHDSERVIDLTERLLEAGFCKETAIQMINGALASSGQEENMSTLDICDLNLYTGECEFIKVGAACTYIKRGQLVDRLSEQNFPLGVFGHLEPEVMYRTLQSGDYVVMLSDGVLDALSQGIGAEILPEIIGRMEYSNPNEMAGQILAFCLRQSRGQVRDDMTVLVMGVWNKNSDYNIIDA